MSQFIVFGTVHNHTPCNELISEVSKVWPDQVLVEIVQRDIVTNNLSVYPDAMKCILGWSQQMGLAVAGIDSVTSTSSASASAVLKDQMWSEQNEITKQYSWKQCNNPLICKLLRTPSWLQLVNQQKFLSNQMQLLSLIHQYASPSAETVAIIVSAMHLEFLSEHIVDAQFPLWE